MPNYTTSYQQNPRLRHRKPRRRQGRRLPPPHERDHMANLRPLRRGMPDLRHSQGFGHRAARRQRNNRLPYVLIAIGVAAVVFVASIVLYINRSVPITLNGEPANVRIHSTIDQVVSSQGLEPEPGDLLAVDDSVLEKGKGEPFEAELNGEALSGDAKHTTQLTGGEELSISDGGDTYEEHQVQATEIQPTLTVEGTGAVQYVEQWGVPGRSEVWTGQVSGKTQDRGVVQEVQDCVVRCRNVVPDEGSYVALTFNLAPSTETEQILQVLEEKGVTATFFMLGDSMERRQDMVKAVADAGCEIGTMGTENESLSDLSSDELRSRISAGFSDAEAMAGVTTRYFRAPLQSFGDEQWAEAMDLVACNVQWNIDAGDWLVPGTDTVVSNVLDSVSNGNIVLLTDSGATDGETLEALPDIIDGLQAQGYEIVSLSALLATDDDIPPEVADGTASMPEDAVLPQLKPQANETDADGETAEE